MNPKILKSSLYTLIFVFGAFASYWLSGTVFPVDGRSKNSTATPTPSPGLQTGFLTFQGPKTEVCPINGEKFTVEEQKIWSTRRPLLVMIENHADSRPQSGLTNADIVYEAVAEGGITRFMGVFYCNATRSAANKYDVGPVRSARTYFLDLASEYSDYPLYAHVGGANCSAATVGGPCTTNVKAQAIEQIAKYGWNNKGTWGDLSQFSLSYKACRREPDRVGVDVATEHTMYCSTTELWNVAASRGLTNMTEINNSSWDKTFRPWSFKAEDKSLSTTASAVSFDFWGDKAYTVSWKYDPSTNKYLRSNGGQPAVDFNYQQVVSTKNLVIQFAKESRSIDEHAHNLYGLIGSGTGVYLANGQKTEITWTKTARQGRTVFKDSATGKEINFVPGQIWVEILPIGNKISYEG
ncbi:MAG: hypothetical protein US68_C0008G0091 [Candidatus Shapirobacteria bacterium GW2011_GWE1_38_10]|uniref:DUF3048 domain-containing protein n=1 Tax=Candidatus Shapirobacteria bacterium GW2011_GWE1_38_10 TaxID=1618488 RepID=A0A0G0LC49_9BACT|nr:MAG: hypothetical protein US46_C0006G0054 [Candidatus Shapirobacteria bacterium GW2011_GWF2_37_20]KKQ50206.1 MAG: hypothetical protein US68_C0008G0091 [Candidatus Shapirobacteria bacterium GW2011_GWE1_38_10]KKQ63776.1 MAG: hypothetical protein US85_C0014G0008 [Candidatus Shapirobacteria bacterium GW2011_GWF1_38_23]HBP50748.1 hypothetical protein [Candidatus Shapirobacteria bacterium]